MSLLPDDIYLGDINLPGSHDAAAINPVCKDAFARHYLTITEQLEFGIRLLDIRLQYKETKSGTFDFLTCHGNIGSAISRNTYQPFSKVLDECEAFLQAQPTETIILSLKVDDNCLKDEQTEEKAHAALKTLLSQYTVRPYQQDLGTLQEARGQMILFNRINTDTALGYPMQWKDNFDGVTDATYEQAKTERNFTIGVQDHYNFGLNVTDFNHQKTDNVFAAMPALENKTYDVLWNYASACTLYVLAVSPYPEIMARYSKMQTDVWPVHTGWVLMDYEDRLYGTEPYGYMSLVSLLIDSNPLNGERFGTYSAAFTIQ